jgi:PmbA protein
MSATTQSTLTSQGETADTSPKALLQLVADVLDEARKLGASSAEAGVSSGVGLDVTVRMGELESLEHQRDRGLNVTVYVGQRKGTASSSDFKPEALRATVAAAHSIATHTGEDPCAGLADADLLAREIPDLDLDHPWDLSPEQAKDLALRCESAARAVDPRITNSEGATVGSYRGYAAYGNSLGFLAGYGKSRHSIACSVIGSEGQGMQRSGWYTVARDAADLEAAESVGRIAGERALRKLGARPIPTGTVPVLFEAPVADSLFGHFLNAISGGSLYRNASFLQDSIGNSLFPSGFYIKEEPHLRKGIGSAPFDGDGVATHERELIKDGVLQGYVLSAYSARKLGMTTTGNAGGVHNVLVAPGDEDLAALLKRMHKGLLVTGLIGFGVNMVTGDYSRGASGFWIENGEIVHPVEEITIAGNLKEMFQRIVTVGKDVDRRSNVQTGSVLIEAMMVAGK